MPRPRRQHQADDAAQAASEAARTLAQRSHEVRQEREPVEVTEKVPTEVPEDFDAGPRNRPHTKAFEEIVSSRNAEPAPEPTEVKEEPKVEAAPEVVQEAPAEPVVEMVKVKIDGEELEVEKEEVDAYGGVKAYQIQKAAENRLRKSNEVLAENRKFQAAMVELLQQMQQNAKPKETQVSDDQFIASKLDIIRFGTPEDASKAWVEIQNRSNKPVDTNAIIEQATNRFKHDQAVQDFDKEFQDLAANPLLLKLVVSMRNERIPQLKGPVDWHNFYRSIGNEVRTVIGKPTSQTVTTATSGTTSQQSDKEARKAATVVSLPTSAARAEPPKEEKPQTRDDILREMKKKRGLPVD